MGERIILSKEHGLNPSMINCPKCDKDMAIALNGYIKGDKKAPKVMYSQESCDDCKKDFIILIYEGELFAFINRLTVNEELKHHDIMQITKVDLEILKEKQNG